MCGQLDIASASENHIGAPLRRVSPIPRPVGSLARHAGTASYGALWLPHRCDVKGFEPGELGDTEVAEGHVRVAVTEEIAEPGDDLYLSRLAAATRAQVATVLSHLIRQDRVGVLVAVAERHADGTDL